MNKTIKNTTISIAASIAFLAISASSIYAAPTVTPTKTAANKDEKISSLITKADEAIAKRVASLTAANTKINAAKKLSDSQKSALVASNQAIITKLNTLKTKIDADTDAATLRTDAKSIFASYRVYALVLPQAAIISAADRLNAVVVDMTALFAKLQDRITKAKADGKDTAAMQTSLDDMKSKIADATKQSDAAVNHVSTLVPDEGDKSKMASNKSELEMAHADIKIGAKDLKAARENAMLIVTALKALK